jgi:polyisoprenoid-binding protein YceI
MSTQQASYGFPFRWVIAGFVLWGLVACQTSPPTSNAPTTKAPAPAPVESVPEGAQEYAVVAEESLLQILVYRGGAMARLGHNHVIASHQLSGAVSVTDDPLQSRFDISIPVNELAIDEPAMREMAGPDFPPGVPQSARDGTRKNLLSEALLDGAKYPAIRLRATDVAAAGEGFDVGVEITLKDQVRVVRVPVTIERKQGELVARGEFPLKQSELGFKPFSVAMGTLVVLDEMRIRFEVVARKGPGTVP